MDFADEMDFADALKEVFAGRRVARKGWTGKGIWISLATIKDMTVPNVIKVEKCSLDVKVIILKTVDGTPIPWVASQSDMLADDWEVVT